MKIDILAMSSERLQVKSWFYKVFPVRRHARTRTQTHTHSHADTHALARRHTDTHTRARAHDARTHTHAHTHAHTHTHKHKHEIMTQQHIFLIQLLFIQTLYHKTLIESPNR